MDEYSWVFSEGITYVVGDVYHMLTKRLEVVWHKKVSSEVSICAWRLLGERLRTKLNLVIRGIISQEE